MEPELEVESLEHLGLVAGVIDALGLVELTDVLLPRHQQNCISCGQVLKAVLLNCFGFLSAPLYLFSEFFESKPAAHLLGEGIEARHLNDDRIGRVLDALYESGSTMFFLKAAMQAVQRFGIKTEQCHLDSSSFSVDGEYLSASPTESPVADEDEFQPIQICRGDSRDQRPDLKQYMMNLVCSRDGGVPLWLKVASGNQSDGPAFADILQEFDQQWDIDALFVMDAAFYSETNLKTVSSFNWLSRVPQTISAAKALISQSTDELTAVDCTLKDYQLWEVPQTYAGIEQRWILIESASRKANQAL